MFDGFLSHVSNMNEVNRSIDENERIRVKHNNNHEIRPIATEFSLHIFTLNVKPYN